MCILIMDCSQGPISTTTKKKSEPFYDKKTGQFLTDFTQIKKRAILKRVRKNTQYMANGKKCKLHVNEL